MRKSASNSAAASAPGCGRNGRSGAVTTTAAAGLRCAERAAWSAATTAISLRNFSADRSCGSRAPTKTARSSEIVRSRSPAATSFGCTCSGETSSESASEDEEAVAVGTAVAVVSVVLPRRATRWPLRPRLYRTSRVPATDSLPEAADPALPDAGAPLKSIANAEPKKVSACCTLCMREVRLAAGTMRAQRARERGVQPASTSASRMSRQPSRISPVRAPGGAAASDQRCSSRRVCTKASGMPSAAR